MPVKTVRTYKDPKAKRGWYHDNQRMEAVKAYCLLGKMTLVAATTRIPEDTLRHWKMQDWWKEAEEEFRRSSKIELSGKLSKIIDRTLLALEDRIENGDFFFNPVLKTWERKPVNANVLQRVTSDLIDKQEILDKSSTVEKANDETINNRLKFLAEQLVKFAKNPTKQPNIIEAEVLQDEGSMSSGQELVQSALPRRDEPVQIEGPSGGNEGGHQAVGSYVEGER